MRRNTLMMVSAFLSLLLSIPGGAGCQSSPEKQLNGIDSALQDYVHDVERTKGFLQPLKTFDFENASFLSDVRSSIEDGHRGLQEAFAALERLEGFDYRGSLSHLGELINELVRHSRSALKELEEVQLDIEKILNSIEPVLEEEATITQLEAPQSTQEWVQRLLRLDAALSASLQGLGEIGVQQVKMERYRAYFLDLLTTLHSMVKAILYRISAGLITSPDPRLSSYFQHLEELLSSHQGLTEELDNQLLINQLDVYLEEVELEINRLFLESE